jgi:ABC-type sugar transport system permease subunit
MTTATTNAAAGIITRKQPVRAARGRRAAKVVHRARLYAILFALMLPTLAGMLLFTYYPQWGAIKYSLYNWDGDKISEFIGLKNFVEAFSRDTLFWRTFQLVGILLIANLFKMWPSIFAAVALHRIRSERWQYIYRVLFVIPMIIPALVGLLVWKTFYDSTTGVLNTFLNATGLMGVLNWLDQAMPKLAATLAPAREAAIDPIGGVWGLAVVGALILFARRDVRSAMRAWVGWLFLSFAVSWAYWDVMAPPLQAGLGNAALVVLGVAALSFVIVFAVAVALAALRSRLDSGWHNWAGGLALVTATFFLLTTLIWTVPTQAFLTGAPAWLGHSKLIVPAILLWGFPWIGTVGVLIYLAGLQNISNDVYEAAEIDGLGKFWSLELPLILTQVRINLIFMTIGTLSDYGLFFLLLGPDGGPGNVGMVPGLYMYKSAFVEGRFGYACALGMVLFVMILAITVVYQKYVKVDK